MKTVTYGVHIVLIIGMIMIVSGASLSSGSVSAQTDDFEARTVTLTLQKSLAMVMNNDIDVFTLDQCFGERGQKTFKHGEDIFHSTKAFREIPLKKSNNVIAIHFTQYYYSLAKYQGLKELQEQFTHELRHHYRNVKKLYEKGLIADVEVLKVKRWHEEGRVKFLGLESNCDHLILLLKDLLHLEDDFKVVVESLPRVIPHYSDFSHWLQTSLRNQGLIQEKDILGKDFDFMTLFPKDIMDKLTHLYIEIDDVQQQMAALEEIVKTNTMILTFQKKRFAHSLASGDEVTEAFAVLYEAKERQLALLHAYHMLVLDGQLAFEYLRTVRKK